MRIQSGVVLNRAHRSQMLTSCSINYYVRTVTSVFTRVCLKIMFTLTCLTATENDVNSAIQTRKIRCFYQMDDSQKS